MAIESNLCDDCMGRGVDLGRNICETCKGVGFDPKKSKYTLRFGGVLPDQLKGKDNMARGIASINDDSQDAIRFLATSLHHWTKIIEAREVAKEIEKEVTKIRLKNGAIQYLVIQRKLVPININ